MLPLSLSADSIEEQPDAATVESPPPAAHACDAAPVEVPLANEFGSVGFAYNIAEHPKSIRAVAARLLSKALDEQTTAQLPECAEDCREQRLSQVVYKVAPTQFLAADQQQELCVRLDQETTARPLKFGTRQFASVTELNDWITAFSQGRGADGKRLYAQCGANCSPRYTFLISKVKTNLTVEAQVQCGLARDRANDQYSVSTAMRTTCPAKPGATQAMK